MKFQRQAKIPHLASFYAFFDLDSQLMRRGSKKMQERRRKNVREAAAYIGSSKSKLDKLRCYGGGPRYYKIDSKVVYDEADLDAWLAERARTNTSQNYPRSEAPRDNAA